MKKLFLGGFASLLFFLSACTAMHVDTKVQQGRMALLYGDPKVALGSFQSAAELDPNYLYFGLLAQGIWTYVGRADYAAGRYPEAQQALERAVSLQQEDNMARLYLGLTLLRSGDRQRGLRDFEGGMRGLHEWFDYVNQYAANGHNWDPAKEIRSEIQNGLAMISGKVIDWQKLTASGEWVGRKVEEEIDLVRWQESRDQSRGGD